MWHHCRLLFRLVSSNSQPHSSPQHSRRREKSPALRNSAADCATDQSIRSSAVSPLIHSHLNPLFVLISLSFFRAFSNSSFIVSRSMLRGTLPFTVALKMRWSASRNAIARRHTLFAAAGFCLLSLLKRAASAAVTTHTCSLHATRSE